MRILMFLFLIILVSCARNEKPFLGDSNYTINLKIICNNNYSYIDYRKDDFKASITTNTGWHLKERYMFSRDSYDHYFMKNDIEIEFVRSILVSIDSLGKIPYNWDSKPGCYLIGSRDIAGKQKSFVIFWINKPLSHSGINGYKPYDWEINETTDSIYSTLNYNTIKELYPRFKGSFKEVQIDTIIIDETIPYTYKDYDEFYNYIRFISVNFGTSKKTRININN